MPSLSSASTTRGPSPPQVALRPRPGMPAAHDPTGPPAGLDEDRWRRGPRWSSCRACRPPRRPGAPAPIAASAPDRCHTGIDRGPRRLELGVVLGCRGGHDDGVDPGRQLGARRHRRRRRRPSAASGPRNGLSALGSWPETVWPISASSVATALMPAPPTLVTWMRRATDRSRQRAHPRACSSARRGDGVGRVRAGPGPGAALMAARTASSASSRSTSAASRLPSREASGTRIAPPGGDEPLGVAGLLVGGDDRRGHQHGGHAHRGQLEARARPGPAHGHVGGGQHRGHVVLVLDGAVVEPAEVGRQRRRDPIPVARADDVQHGQVVAAAPGVEGVDHGEVHAAARPATRRSPAPAGAAGRGPSRRAPRPGRGRRRARRSRPAPGCR